MARITIEDCLEICPDRFELVVLTTKRAREIAIGESPLVNIRNDKDDVIALREIASGHLNINRLKKNAMKEIQKITDETYEYEEEQGEDYKEKENKAVEQNNNG